jgi:hypothetical protein
MEPERIVYARGTPWEIGVARGRALGPRMEQNIRAYAEARTQPGTVNPEQLRAGALPYLRSLPARFQEELAGLAEGAGLPLQRIAEWVYLEPYLWQARGCSAFICLLDGRAWVGRNNDMLVPHMWGYAAVREVEGRIPTITFSLEGDVFAPTGYNGERLWLHLHDLPAWDAPQPGQPQLLSFILLVEALETCATLSDVEALLDRVDRVDSMQLFAVDGKTDAFAIYECSYHAWRRRPTEGQWLVGTNHHPGDPEAGKDSVARYQRLQERVSTLASGRVSIPEDLIAILADDGVEARGQGYGTVYANVACPSSGALWYTLGGYPAASRGNWQQLPLAFATDSGYNPVHRR